MATNVKYPVARITRFRLTQLIYISGLATTYAISPWSNYDPISLPKMFSLALGSFTILLFVIGSRKIFIENFQSSLLIASGSFLFFLISTLFLSEHKISSQFWGSFGRNTGFLTYASLLLILFATHLLADIKLYERIIFAFTLGVIPMTLYGFIQLAGRDPIAWSEKAVFGTLGNINFLSAYFGMTSVAAIALASSRKYKNGLRIFITSLALVNVSIATSTKSIQGPIIFISGLAAVIFFHLTQAKQHKALFLVSYFVVAVSGVTAVVYALFNKGPLASVIFQPSVIFRGDYMHAGWKMMLDHPLLGVGLDNYGDWYREVRGEISTLRTGPGRISNTAHNIFLDIGSNGGVPLFIAYVTITLLAGGAIFGFIRKGTIAHPVVLAASATWISYQIQALVSINQIGVGIWGWIFSGMLIGMRKIEISSSELSSLNSKIENFKDLRGKSVPARLSMHAFAGAALGATLAFPPLSADIAYRAATKTGQFENIYQATQKLGSSEFHGELLLDFAHNRNLASEVRLAAEGLLDEYPRNFFAWRLLSIASTGTDLQRLEALNKARALDPFNPELRQ